MSIESIESETMQQFIGESLFEEESKELWNGRNLCTSQANPQIDEVRKAALLYPMSLGNMQQGKPIISTVTTQECSERNFHTDVILCGEKVDGKASVSGSADTEGNKKAEVEVEGSSKSGNVSASVSGSISQDKEGKTSGEVKGKVEVRF